MYKAGFQGLRGAFSEMALKRFFGDGVEPLGFNEFEDVFSALQKGFIDYGVVPLENSIAGTVTENYDLMLRYDVRIIGEVYIKIEHCLMGVRGAKLEGVTHAFSHPHALKQCRDFMKQHNITAVAKYDTAGSSAYVAREGNPAYAGIASRLCAEIYDMDLLVENIQANNLNTTRFAIIEAGAPDINNLEYETKTTLAFKAKHRPGELLKCLEIFARHQLNLTKLESRPIVDIPWEYIFYTDFEIGPETPKGSTGAAVKELLGVALKVKVLGTYPKAV